MNCALNRQFSFKTFLITLLSLTLLFSISCSNEGTTGGNTGDDYWYNPDTNNNNITPPPIIQGELTASATENITINILNQKVHSNGSVSFMVRPSKLQNTENFTVSIDSVAKATGNSSSLELTPTDFSSLTPSSKELTLSADGLNKVNSASGLEDNTTYKYDITFKFTTTSDTVSNKIASYTSTVSLYKIGYVTLDTFKNMIASTPNLTFTNRSSIDKFSDSFTIEFSKASVELDAREKRVYVKIDHPNMGMIRPTSGNSTYSRRAFTEVLTNNFQFGTTETRKFLSSVQYKSQQGSSINEKVLYLYYGFTVKEGYVVDDDISPLTNNSVNLQITVDLDICKWEYGY